MIKRDSPAFLYPLWVGDAGLFFMHTGIQMKKVSMSWRAPGASSRGSRYIPARLHTGVRQRSEQW